MKVAMTLRKVVVPALFVVLVPACSKSKGTGPDGNCAPNYCSTNGFSAEYHCDGNSSVLCSTDGSGCPTESARTICSQSCEGGFCTFVPPDPGASLLLHSSFDSAQSVFEPEFSTATYATLADAIPGLPGYVSFEPGQVGNGARIDSTGFRDAEAPLRFKGQNFDFDDLDNNGGRIDFIVKFNVDPHGTYANTWLARTNYGKIHYNFNWEFASGDPNVPAQLMVDVYSDILHNYRTSYENFRVTPRGWSVYQNIREGEWHIFTVTWRRNGGPHKAELHFYIDGTQEGCYGCSDYNGNLPPEGQFGTTDLFFSPPLWGGVLLFSVDEIYSFSSWDVSGVTGAFADLQIPEGVTLTYPEDARGPWQGVYGAPVPTSTVVYEFFAVNDQTRQFECDLYVDTLFVTTVVTTSQAHTEVTDPTPLADGKHTFQVKCDNDRLVSRITEFNVAVP